MTLEFQPPPGDTPTINVVLLGPPKTGKTTGAASAPGKILYLNTELPTATRFARLTHGERLAEVKFEGMSTLVDATYEVYNADTGFSTVVVDSVGELYRLLLEEESKGAIRPTLNQYGDTTSNVERFCRAMCKSPLHAVFVCHDHPVRDEASGETERLPWTGTGNPKLGRNLMGMVDVVGFTGVVEQDGSTEYVAQLIPAKGRPGGDRFNALGKTRPVDLAEWIEAIRQKEQA